LLPRWARRPLRLPYLPVTEATVVRTSGAAIVRGIRWATSPPAWPDVDGQASLERLMSITIH